MICNNDDPDYLREQLRRLNAEREQRIEQIKRTPIKVSEPVEAPKRGPGCGLFMVVAVAWCLVACAPTRSFKDKSADVLDVARQLHWEGCEAEDLLQEDLCDKAYNTLIFSEPGMEDEFAKKRRLQAMWNTLEPVVIPYLESGVLTAAQLLLAYLTGNLIGGALQLVQQPP